MTYPLTISASAMREVNRSAILEIIRRESPISRTILAKRLNLSLPTVMRIVDRLIDEDFVRPAGTTEWSGGRRRPLLEYNAEGYLVIGVDMGGTKMYGAVADLGGSILEEAFVKREAVSPEASFNYLKELIDRFLRSPVVHDRKIRGIGVGAPGVTLHEAGIVSWAYVLQWEQFPLKERLSARYDLPITVENDVNLAALGEHWFGAGQNIRNMVLLAIGTGIGAGIIIDGNLYRGAHEASGEIGNMIPGREFLGKDFHQFGALEQVASQTGMTIRAREILAGTLREEELEALTVDGIFDAARRNEPWAWLVMNEMVDYVSIAIANLVSAFDPELVVLGGRISPYADVLLPPVTARLKQAIPNPPKLVISYLGLKATVMGAITNVLHNTSNFYVVHRLT